jgi:ABC-type nitrate/sulfonate/bicarbonate transport system substrate-binding protein
MALSRRAAARMATALLAALVLVATGCGGDDDGGSSSSSGSAATQKVTLMLDWTPNTNHSGFYVAKEKGWYKDAGIDLDIVEPSQDGGLPQLAAGNVQFAVTVAEQLIPARAEGVKATSIATIIQHNTSSLVAPADRGITRPRDLEGKTYGGFGGQLEQALIDSMVRCDGGDPSKVKSVEVGNVDYKVGLDRKDYDFVWLFDGWDVIRLRDLDGMALTTLPFHGGTGPGANCIPDWYTPILAASDDLIAKDPDLVRRFTSATAKGFELARTDPDAASAALLAAVPESDKQLVPLSAKYLADRYADPGSPWGRQDPAIWSGFEEFLRTSGLTTAEVDTSTIFTNEFLPSS